MPDARKLNCSWCDKDQSEVQKLIAGPAVFICDECVLLCLSMLMVNGEDLLDERIAAAKVEARAMARALEDSRNSDPDGT